MNKASYSLRDVYPLLILLSLILGATLLIMNYKGLSFKETLRMFMAMFFLVFGLFKAINLLNFAKGYAEYDLIAKRFYWYGFLYPFFELGLSFAYFKNIYPYITNIVTAMLMSVSAIGVGLKLRQTEKVMCACLGMVFKVPMTYVTLIENILMVGMAIVMLCI